MRSLSDHRQYNAYQLVKYAAWTYVTESRRCVLLYEASTGVSIDAAKDDAKLDSKIMVKRDSMADTRASKQMGGCATSHYSDADRLFVNGRQPVESPRRTVNVVLGS